MYYYYYKTFQNTKYIYRPDNFELMFYQHTGRTFAKNLRTFPVSWIGRATWCLPFPKKSSPLDTPFWPSSCLDTPAKPRRWKEKHDNSRKYEKLKLKKLTRNDAIIVNLRSRTFICSCVIWWKQAAAFLHSLWTFRWEECTTATKILIWQTEFPENVRIFISPQH